MILSGSITRTELALPDLALFGSSGYHLLGGAGNEESSLQAGQMVRRNRVAESDFLDGGVLVHSTVGMRSLAVSWLVYGDDVADAKARTTVLIAALGQAEYVLTVVVDGTPYSWQCWPADWSVAFGSAHVKASVIQVNTTIPAQPGYF